MTKTNIEWTEETWNPIVGCSILSPGCTNCYAMRMASRVELMNAKAIADGKPAPSPQYLGTTDIIHGNPVWTGKLALARENILLQPLKRKKPTIYFVNSMGDLFHESVPDEWIDQVFAIMAVRPQHTFQVLTKRARRMRDYCSDPQTPFRIAQAIDALTARRDACPEEVRPIAGYPGYFASSHGFIYSEKRGTRKRMSPDVGEEGHQRVQLHREGKEARHGDRLLVHRIILETFVGPAPYPDAQGRHRDRNPTNNAAANLLWGDQSANWGDAKRHGSHRRYSKLTERQAADIRRRHAGGETGEALAREFDVSATQIRNIAAGRQWAVEAPLQWPLANVWKGVSTERQKEADERIPYLLSTPAAVRFISAEPLLGPIDLNRIHEHHEFPGGGCADGWESCLNGKRFDIWSDGDTEGHPKLDWVICGGESGPGSRPMHPDWARSLRDQCLAAGVPFFFKQWGNWHPELDRDRDDPDWRQPYADYKEPHFRILNLAGGCGFHGERVHVMRYCSKKSAGCKLDGIIHHEMPEAFTGRLNPTGMTLEARQ